MTIPELKDLVHGRPDDDAVELFIDGDLGAVGTATGVMPGVPGLVIRKADGQTQVCVIVRRLRHALRLLSRAA